MADAVPSVLELDSETMWVLADDRQSLTLSLVLPNVGLSEPLHLQIDFDGESIELMVERLVRLRAQMELSP